MNEIMLILGKNIRNLRVKSGWTQEKLAEKAGISVPFMTQIELARKSASLEVIQNIAMALGYKQESDWPDAFRTAYNFTVKQYGISENYKERTAPIHIGTAGTSFTLPNGQTIGSCAGVTDVQKAVEKAANVYNGIVWRDQPYAGTDYNAAAAINLSHLFGYFLTAFDSFTTGFNSNYTLDTNYDDSFFVTKDPDFRFAVLEEGTETDEDEGNFISYYIDVKIYNLDNTRNSFNDSAFNRLLFSRACAS